MTHVISVSDVSRSKQPLPPRTVQAALQTLTGRSAEACSDASGNVIVSDYHPFVAALHIAFALHYPIVLSPDMLWLLVAQGFARIVNDDPEAHRRHFVEHDGKQLIAVRRDEFVPDSPDNNWPGVFSEFSDKIRTHIGEENHASLVVTYSTTGAVELAANEIVLMDAMQSYCEYAVLTLCGIPEVQLEGTPGDWAMLTERTANLGRRYECEWWTDQMAPFLGRVTACTTGCDDVDLWQTIYKCVDGSGGPFVGGWITKFFPFLQDGRDQPPKRNPHLRGEIVEPLEGVTSSEWPGSLSCAPFVWEFLNGQRDMEFVAGFTHVTQDEETLALRPSIGWAVRAADPN